ncbi:dihydrolipoamide branched chain transacylase E2 [Verticillium alfalfae VaMs.102]|uniref:Dihydrolipoamide acetyltransferase component of pyruvate dehydrogenase complex n=1 Tax=Verticillium alfalfae (strain VaMs.102 / ATCC MYA-4576 / FGSC 10136) TaxID=526221 RepID=C9SID8_VERA1|nr:dihydrolipoamide branched chain transacylase E2 [Verticillium alfalfae VaMs.102]EEY18711.1 dihydrolipoamide branched chain transacylase E2 [Verticillium alfalfae VaMs.102]
MFLSKSMRTRWSASKSVARLAVASRAGLYPSSSNTSSSPSTRPFHSSRPLRVVKPVLLADIGEGIVECEVIQWFVEPGARVEEFSPLCEVQSDKASVEITSRFSGVVKKLYYEAGDMAKVGKAFVDIDIQGGAKQEDLDTLIAPEAVEERPTPSVPQPESASAPAPAAAAAAAAATATQAHTAAPEAPPSTSPASETPKPKGKCAALATPAVRHLSKELKIDIAEIDGTGRDGRVLKEDIYKFVKTREATPAAAPPSPSPPAKPQRRPPRRPLRRDPCPADGTRNTQMFKSMTRSLRESRTFLYADEGHFYGPASVTLPQNPVLNARVDHAADAAQKPALVLRPQHNIGIAMDTPSGLLVPVIKDVANRTLLSIAAELARLQGLALAGRLPPADMTGGTITVSNIGNIGGTYLSPVIVEREVAILGIGRMRPVPAFDDAGQIVKKHVSNFSWCADHRVVDGATMARAAEVVRRLVEEPDVMVMHLR